VPRIESSLLGLAWASFSTGLRLKNDRTTPQFLLSASYSSVSSQPQQSQYAPPASQQYDALLAAFFFDSAMDLLHFGSRKAALANAVPSIKFFSWYVSHTLACWYLRYLQQYQRALLRRSGLRPAWSIPQSSTATQEQVGEGCTALLVLRFRILSCGFVDDQVPTSSCFLTHIFTLVTLFLAFRCLRVENSECGQVAEATQTSQPLPWHQLGALGSSLSSSRNRHEQGVSP